MKRQAQQESSSLFRNTWLNLLGQGLPLVLAFLVFPILLRWMGPDRTGILTTLWVVMGYFLLLDLGLGRAIVHLVADCVAKNRRADVPNYVWGALGVIGGVSAIGSLALAFFASNIIALLLNVPANLRAESEEAFMAVALSLPFVSLTACLRGVLEARQKFLGANLLQGFSSGANIFVPLVTLAFTPNLAVMAWALLGVRAALLLVNFKMAAREFPELTRKIVWDRQALNRLFRFGGWATVSNAVGPVLVYLDRLVVSSRIDAAVVPIYAIPHEAVMRLLILPAALSRALFPRLSSLDVESRKAVARRSLAFSTVVMFPIALVMVYFATEILTVWLGPEIGRPSVLVLKILAVGYFFNSAAHVPFIQIQSAERPDLSAKVHLLELPFYIVLLLYLVSQYGPTGAAIAWLMRVVFDAVFIFVLAARVTRSQLEESSAKGGLLADGWAVCLGALLFLPAFFIDDFLIRFAVASVAIVFYGATCWRFWFDQSTREWVAARLPFRTTKGAS